MQSERNYLYDQLYKSVYKYLIANMRISAPCFGMSFMAFSGH